MRVNCEFLQIIIKIFYLGSQSNEVILILGWILLSVPYGKMAAMLSSVTVTFFIISFKMKIS